MLSKVSVELESTLHTLPIPSQPWSSITNSHYYIIDARTQIKAKQFVRLIDKMDSHELLRLL